MSAHLPPPILLDDTDKALVDHFQRDFPLVERPYARLGAQLGIGSADVIARLARLVGRGAISRIGAVVRPHAAGCSTLAALSVPEERLDAVAELVSGEPGVTHNYAREHAYNLWFVVTGRTREDVNATLARIEARVGAPVLDLPMERAFHIDLGFTMFGERRRRVTADHAPGGRADGTDLALLAAIEGGIALVERPFLRVAAETRLEEGEVLARLARMIERGVVSRFGVVVKHRALGFGANAMTVWDLADEAVDEVAADFAADPDVTLCYRRPRRPSWRYNLFCMVHATERAQALATIRRLRATAGPALADQATLFSTRCYKQRGAVFSASALEGAA